MGSPTKYFNKSEFLCFQHFVKLDNKLTSICTSKTCCKNACINSNVNYGSCNFNKGFVRIVDYLRVEYHSVEGGKGWKICKN